MGLDDFSLGSNNQNKKMNNVPHGVRKDQLDEKLHNIFNAFDINKDGTLEKEELSGLESWVKGLAGIDGNDKNFLEIEGILGTSIFRKQFNIDENENIDLFGFVKSVSEAAEEIVSVNEITIGYPPQKGFKPNEKIITTKYSDGTVEIIVLYPNGDLKYKKTKKTVAINEVYYTIGDNEQKFTPAEIENRIKEMYKEQYAPTNAPYQENMVHIAPPPYLEFKNQIMEQFHITKHDFETKEVFSDRYTKELDAQNLAKNINSYLEQNNNALNDEAFIQLLNQINPNNILDLLNEYENQLFDKNLIALILGESGNNDEEMKFVLTGPNGIFTNLFAKAETVGMTTEAINSYKNAINDEINERLSGLTISPDTERLNGLLLALKNSIQLYEKNPQLSESANSHWYQTKTEYEQGLKDATLNYVLQYVSAAREQIEAHYEFLKENMFYNLGEIVIEDIRFWVIDKLPLSEEIVDGIVGLAESLGFDSGDAEALLNSIHNKIDELRNLEFALRRLQPNSRDFNEQYKNILGVEYMPEAMNGLMHLVENAPWKDDPKYIQYLQDLQHYEFNKKFQNGNFAQPPLNNYQDLFKPDPNRPIYSINTNTEEYKQYAKQIEEMMLAIVGKDYMENIQDYVGTSASLGSIVEMAVFIYATMGMGSYGVGASWTTRAASSIKNMVPYTMARSALNFSDDILKMSGITDNIGWTDTHSFEHILGDRQNITFGGILIGENNAENFRKALTIVKNWFEGNITTEVAQEAFKNIEGFSFDDFFTSKGGQFVLNTASMSAFAAASGIAAPLIAKIGEWGAKLGTKLGMNSPELSKVGLEILANHPEGLNGIEFLTQVAVKMQSQNAVAIGAKFIAETAVFFTTNLSLSMVQEVLSESNTELEDAWAKGPDEFAKYLATRFGEEAINLLEIKSIGMIIAMMMGMNQQAVIRDNYSQYETMKNVTIRIEDIATASNTSSTGGNLSTLHNLSNIPEGKCITITGPTGKLVVDGNISKFFDHNGKLLNQQNIGNNEYQNADAVTKTIFLLHTYMCAEANFAPSTPSNPVQDAEIVRPLELGVKPEVTLPQTINPLNSNAGNTSATRAFTPKAIEVTSLYNKNIRSEYYNQNKKYPLYTTRGIDVEFSAESGAQRLRRVTFPKNEPVILVSQIGTNAGTTTLDKTLFTYEMIECAALAVVDKANNRQTLIHVNPGQSIEANRAIIEHILSGSNPKDVEFSIVHGDSERTFSTIQFILDTIGEVAPESNVKLYNFDTFGKFGGVLLKNGELTCCDVNTLAIHNGTYTNIQHNPTANITRAIETTAKPLKEFNPQEEASKFRTILNKSGNDIRTNENVEQYITDIVKLAQENPQIPSDDIYNLTKNWNLGMRMYEGEYDFNDFKDVVNLTAKHPKYQADLIKLMSKEKYTLEDLQKAMENPKFEELAEVVGVEQAFNNIEVGLLGVGKEKFDTINKVLFGEKPVELTEFETTIKAETGLDIHFDNNISIERAQQYLEKIKIAKARYDLAGEKFPSEIFVTTIVDAEAEGVAWSDKYPNTICVKPIDNIERFEHNTFHESVHLSDMNYKSGESKYKPIGTKLAVVNDKVTDVYDRELGNRITTNASKLIGSYSVYDTNEFLAEIGAMILEGKITIKIYEADNTVIYKKIEYKEPFINIDGKEIELTPETSAQLDEIMDYYFQIGGKTYAEKQTEEITIDRFTSKLRNLEIPTEILATPNGNMFVKFQTWENLSQTKFDYAEFDSTGKLIKIKTTLNNTELEATYPNIQHLQNNNAVDNNLFRDNSISELNIKAEIDKQLKELFPNYKHHDSFMDRAIRPQTALYQLEAINFIKNSSLDFRDDIYPIIRQVNKSNIDILKNIIELVSKRTDISASEIDFYLFVNTEKNNEHLIYECLANPKIPFEIIKELIHKNEFANGSMTIEELHTIINNHPLTKAITAIENLDINLTPSNYTPQELNPHAIESSSLVMVHMTNYEPKKGTILSSRDKLGTPRNSVHFTLNHAVKAHRGGDWDNNNLAIIMPYEATVELNGKDKIIEGNPNDLYTNGSVKIPEGSIIIKQNTDLADGVVKISDYSTIPGVKLIETNQPPHSLTETVIKKMGYTFMSANSPFGQFDFGEKQGKSTNDATINFITWKDFCNTQGIKPAMHSYTPGNLAETIINCISILRGDNSWTFYNDCSGSTTNFKEMYLQAISTAKKWQAKGYFVSVDLNRLERIIIESSTPKKAYSRIKKELGIESIMKSETTSSSLATLNIEHEINYIDETLNSIENPDLFSPYIDKYF